MHGKTLSKVVKVVTAAMAWEDNDGYCVWQQWILSECV